jgi:phosphatidylserine/phosphatidylglycerophosphate/cardiolipin synthase-like enzyme/uncharacterized membrane protein YdjX (TVP38/TMEM64 family)
MASASRGSLFEPGLNCYRIAHAHRVALLVDGEAYFKAFVQAALHASTSIVILAWDFHSRTRLYHGIAGVPELLGDFLNYLVKRRRSLRVRVLIWDYPVIFAKGRELSPIYGFGWRPRRHIRVRYDDHYPVGASQHQKIVTIDGRLAFCGGLDLTRSRWDSCEHKAGDRRRVNEGETEPYAPFHDTVMAVDAEAARALQEIARDRWRRATGRRLLPRQMRHRLWNQMRRVADRDPWPDELPVSIADIDVAVARTMAPVGAETPIKEVEALHLALIGSARRSIYIENQYFTSNILGEALAARLREPDGPEVIAVLRLSTAGWLEAPTMGTLRTVLLRKLKDADQHGRFHAYYPHIPDLAAGQNCDLHSKLLIADDETLLIGSANFANRSMGLDTECSVAIEARGEERAATAIRGFRNGLLAEHLGVAQDQVEAATAQAGSIGGAIAALQSSGRTLRPYEQLSVPSETMIAIAASLADPEKPVSLAELVAQFAQDNAGADERPRWKLALAIIVGLVALAAVWRYTPLAVWASAEQVEQWAHDFSANAWAPLLVIAAYTPASLVLFPRSLITLFAVIAFGAVLGFVYAFSGILLAALATYLLGLRLDRGAIRRIAGSRLNRLSQIMRERGLLAMTAVRLVPLAPFSVVNMVAGAIRIRLWQFMLGSALGILPGTLVATIFGDQVAAGLRDPRTVNVWLIVAAMLVLGIGTLIVRRWLFGSAAHAAR